MGTARRFSRILHREIDVHAAWLPVTNTFRLGDYGMVSDGVLVKMGNIDEFGVEFVPGAGRPAELQFRSDGTKVRRVVGGAEAPSFPQVDLGAEIVIDFKAADSIYISANLVSEEMQNVAQVGAALRNAGGWRRRYRVVSSVYSAEHCTMISAREANSRITISGTADALRLLELGQAHADVTVSSEESLGLNLAGRSGVVGLRMFTLRALGGGTRLLNADTDEQDLVEHVVDEDLTDDI